MKKPSYMTIDGIPVEIEGEKNILELIRKAGIKLPTFCYHSELSVYGACRMCMVEGVGGRLDAACSAQPRPGMDIRTNTERLRRYRKMILELILANHCRDCTTCQSSKNCKLQDLAARFRIEGVRFPGPGAAARAGRDDSSPCVAKDSSKCILCGDCVRMCNEVQNVGAIDFAYRGSKMAISTAFGEPLAQSGCVGCGQCAAVCPTGAIAVKNDSARLWGDLSSPDVKVTAQIAPAVRVAVGREFGLAGQELGHAGLAENAFGQIVAALRRMGFDEVYDTATGADLTVLEESSELLRRLEGGSGKVDKESAVDKAGGGGGVGKEGGGCGEDGKGGESDRNGGSDGGGEPEYPLFTSCCPAWVSFCEKKHPELVPHLSTCRSPMQMLASVVKEHHAAASARRSA
ncbi:MAG: (2Fe-2S)-binding protein, partial [Clostridiales bacterium]|nr:(2Fe-2S)-binding protein [Clostridiales bacterium]